MPASPFLSTPLEPQPFSGATYHQSIPLIHSHSNQPTACHHSTPFLLFLFLTKTTNKKRRKREKRGKKQDKMSKETGRWIDFMTTSRGSGLGTWWQPNLFPWRSIEANQTNLKLHRLYTPYACPTNRNEPMHWPSPFIPLIPCPTERMNQKRNQPAWATRTWKAYIATTKTTTMTTRPLPISLFWKPPKKGLDHVLHGWSD